MKTFILENGVKVFQYGEPIDTDAVYAEKLKQKFDEKLKPSFKEDGKAIINIELEKEDMVYGLGGNLGGINKRGRVYQSYCTDEPSHTEEKTTLYGAHNFFIVSGKTHCGYFIDFPSRIKYDVGFSTLDSFNIEIFGQDFNLYVIEGETLEEISSKFLQIIGKPYVPPKWGFGYFQSRWGYKNKEEVLEVYNTFKENKIPLEGIYLDLDYMDNFKDFSISKERFDGFKDFVEKLKKDGTYLIPIIDAGVKVEKGYDVYEEGIKGDHFCKDKDGKPYTAAVWPGQVHFPDFFKEDTQKWFGSKYKLLTKSGIEGVWNDMNEPAIFYDQKSIDEAINSAIESKGKNMDVFSFFDLKDKFANLANKDEYYKSFYHQVGNTMKSNDEVHNLYGHYMTKSANIGLKKLLDDKRFVLISRASSIGMHKYGGIWTGDNCSFWSHLDQNIKNMPSLNMCGFFYTGADTGGFGNDCYGEMLVRWLQFSVFTPLLRNHSAIGCQNQEPYVFGKEVKENSKNLIKARYRLLPYIYSEYMKSVNNYKLMFKPLSFEYEDELAKQAEDQLFLGNELMIAPVHKPNHKGRYVYLPQKMVEVSFKGDCESLAVKDCGIHYLSYELEDFKFFLRKNSIIPHINPAMNVKHLSQETLKIIAYVDSEAEYNLYDDDGISHQYQQGNSFNTNIKITRGNDDFIIEVDNSNPSIKEIEFTIIDSSNNIKNKKIKL
ncbi:TIM-barrel domain-containing protein [Proteinivorax hydrogeniformans]|uniref:TIM-barrel domain-containing protein n=1 Tax=Proteinivorax hydrogeniformans TaxID=1826727 RepID=A0AAU8HVI5_9FIRM